jgi:plasmid stabilization system protein ParE
MNREVVLTPRAKDTFLSIILFIQAEWGEKSANTFVKKTYRILDTISFQPYIF